MEQSLTDKVNLITESYPIFQFVRRLDSPTAKLDHSALTGPRTFPVASMAYTIPPVPPHHHHHQNKMNALGAPYSVNGRSLASPNVELMHPAMSYPSKSHSSILKNILLPCILCCMSLAIFQNLDNKNYYLQKLSDEDRNLRFSF